MTKSASVLVAGNSMKPPRSIRELFSMLGFVASGGAVSPSADDSVQDMMKRMERKMPKRPSVAVKIRMFISSLNLVHEVAVIVRTPSMVSQFCFRAIFRYAI